MTVSNSNNETLFEQAKTQASSLPLSAIKTEAGYLDAIDNLSIIENTPVIVVRWTFPKGSDEIKFKRVSQNINHLGYSSQEMLSGEVAWLDLIHPDDISNVYKTVEQAIRDNLDTYINNYRLKNKSGEYRWIEDYASIVRGEDGHVRYFQGVLIDITERKEVEFELSQRNGYFQALHETAVAITNRFDAKELTQSFTVRLAKLFDCEDVFILLVNEETNMLDMFAKAGRFENHENTSISYGEGGTGKAWETAEAIYVEDYSSFADPLQNTISDIKSAAAIPLIVSDVVLGVMGLTYNSPHRFDDFTKEYLGKYAHLVAIALDNAQLHENAELEILDRKEVEKELNRRNSQFQILYETSLSITNRLDLQTLMDSVLSRLTQIANCNDVFMVIPNSQNNNLETVAGTGSFASTMGRTLELGEGVIGRVWETSVAMYVEDYQGFDGKLENLPMHLASFAGVPLVVSDEVIGVLGLAYSEIYEFNQSTIEALTNFAQLTAIALDNAKLLKNAQLELDEKQVLQSDLQKQQQTLAIQMRFRTDLAKLVEESLSGDFDLSKNFYQHVLQRAVEIVPGAEAGSLLVKQDSGSYNFKAANGYDFSELEKVWLEPHELYRDESEKDPLRLFHLDHERLDEERGSGIEKATDDKQILVTLSVPIHIDDKAVALFFLDNFQTVDAFSDDTLHLAKIFTNQITALWQRYLLEESLQENEENYRNLFLQADRDSQELRLLDEIQNTISSQLDLQSLFESVTQKISEIFNFSHTTIAVLQDDVFVVSATHGYKDSEKPPPRIAKDDKVFSLVLKHKEAVLITPNINIELLSERQRAIYHSQIQLPIIVDESLYGIWKVSSDKHNLDSKDIELLKKVTEILVVGIKNAQLHSQVKKELRRSNTLYNISQSVQESKTLDKLMDDIVEEIRSAVGARWAIMYKIDFDRGYIQHISDSKYFENNLPHFTFAQLKNGLTGWAFENQESIFIKKNTVDPRELPEAVEARHGLNVGSFIVTPLIHRGKVLGTLQAINSLDDEDFTEEDVVLLKAVANQTSVGLAQYDLRQKIEHQAYHDSLTELPNRLLFEEELSRVLAEAKQSKKMFATMFLDLDGFKHVNDTLGHEFGDKLLQIVAMRLSSRTRKTDSLARMGGDEFAIILNDIPSKDAALAIGKAYLELFENVFTISKHTVRVGASIGISFYPDDATDASTLLRHADSAMYQSKDAGKNSVSSFTPELAARAKERLELETELREAVKKGGLELYYQPQISFETNECIGVEALLRWNHPTIGFVSPAKFIPIAEESKLILDIGKWVIQEACMQNALWQAEGHKAITMAINISAVQFESPNFMDTVVDALDKSSLDPKCLEIEVTESVVMKDVNIIIDRLGALRALGISIAIDDFGTGYSSLQYLQKLPLDKLKIDRSFVNEIGVGSSAPIASSILALAQSLNLKTVAEGIEEENQIDFLHKLGCDEAQGFYYAKPMPASEVWQWYAKTHISTNGTTKAFVKN